MDLLIIDRQLPAYAEAGQGSVLKNFTDSLFYGKIYRSSLSLTVTS